ncbi:unnamed protein product [Miscanthus lutarioriparius]|uniref:Uncharacterized protein n=1 Tax=Miscanthus lutarioriparius TaxID=422564 RepID=A0A811RWS5_9POAL|nr:unnamed protein product [Miscanthus lutarioriparius]
MRKRLPSFLKTQLEEHRIGKSAKLQAAAELLAQARSINLPSPLPLGTAGSSSSSTVYRPPAPASPAYRPPVMASTPSSSNNNKKKKPPSNAASSSTAPPAAQAGFQPGINPWTGLNHSCSYIREFMADTHGQRFDLPIQNNLCEEL